MFTIPQIGEDVMEKKKLTTAAGAPVVDNNNVITAGPRGPMLLQDVWFLEKLAHFDREVIPERRMHAKGSGAFGTFTVTHDITKYTRAKIFSEVGKKTEMFARFSTVAGERGAADAERDIRGFALKFYTEEGNWDLVGNNTPVFFFRDPLKHLFIEFKKNRIKSWKCFVAFVCQFKLGNAELRLLCTNHPASLHQGVNDFVQCFQIDKVVNQFVQVLPCFDASVVCVVEGLPMGAC